MYTLTTPNRLGNKWWKESKPFGLGLETGTMLHEAVQNPGASTNFLHVDSWSSEHGLFFGQKLKLEKLLMEGNFKKHY